MEVSDQGRGQWGSKFGFIMAAAGSAVGLGNIWRFPYITGQNGGGAFVLVYVICVILIGIPMIFTELGLGRMAGTSTVGAFKKTGSNKFWMLAPFLALSVSFFVLTFYSVIGGWAVGYIFVTLFDYEITFAAFQQDPTIVLPLFAVFMVLTIGIVLGGVSGGIEKASKILMPVLFVLLVLIAIRSVTLDGAMAGLEFYLVPDFSKITGTTVLMALSQAFFSMSVGWGIMITFGSYLPKDSNLIESGLWVGFMDAMVALLAGFMIFPAVFAFGKDPAEGSALVFQVLPEIFSSMPGGTIIGSLFFLLLTVAALTSSISILEVPASYFIDEKKWSRKKSAWIVGIAAFVIGIPSALTAIDGSFFNSMSMPWFGTEVVSVKSKEVQDVVNIKDGLRIEDVAFLKDTLQVKDSLQIVSHIPIKDGYSYELADGNLMVHKPKTVNGWFDIIDTVFGSFFIVIVALMTSLYAGWIINYKKLIENLGQGNNLFTKPLIAGISPAQIYGFMLRYIIPITILLVLLNMIGVLGFFAGT